jgi:hypothetical protein
MKPKTAMVLITLEATGRVGAPTGLLCRPEIGGARFGARIGELREAGCVIPKPVRERNGSERYWLRHLPTGLLDEARRRVGREAAAQARAAAASQPAARVRGVPGTAHNLDGACFCEGCLQRAAGDALADHELAEHLTPATAAGRAKRLEDSFQLPLLGMVA